MKVLPEIRADNIKPIAENTFQLPQGLIGFAEHRHAELLYMPEHLPFLWMRLKGPTGEVNFVVIEPGGIIPDYELELFDNDAENLGIQDSAEVMVLNIVTLHQGKPDGATVNLIGPIVVNRRTRVGRQLVIANYSDYSAKQPLINPANAESRQLAQA